MTFDEPTLYTQLRYASVPTEGWCGASTVLAVAAKIGMRTVRLDALLGEWTRAGWWEDEGSSFSGHFTDKAPRSLDAATDEKFPIINVGKLNDELSARWDAWARDEVLVMPPIDPGP